MYPSIWVVFSLKCCESRNWGEYMFLFVGYIVWLLLGSVGFGGIVGEAFTMGQMQVSVSAIRRSMSVGVVNLFL